MTVGVNLAAPISQPFGIAESSRQFAYALLAARIPFVVNDINPGPRQDPRLETHLSDKNQFPANLIHVNAIETRRFFASKTSAYFANKINIGIMYWELSQFPSKWIPYLKLYDEIWVTSEFIQQTLSKVSPVPVQKISFPLTVETPVCAKPRLRFGLDDKVCVFVFAFDYGSVFERKNPLALVKAFQHAFNRQADALLIINAIRSYLDSDNAKRLREAARNSRIFILDGPLTRRDYFALLAASDCYVSLHRSEGLGIIMAEAMYLGKPIIATDYSGNIDFMNQNNSLLVPHRLVKLSKDLPPYEKGNVWAEPKIDEASQLMRWVYKHRNESSKLGKVASRDIRRLMNPKDVGEEIGSRLHSLIECS